MDIKCVDIETVIKSSDICQNVPPWYGEVWGGEVSRSIFYIHSCNFKSIKKYLYLAVRRISMGERVPSAG